ncbi:MAG: M14 family metallocarboxypeptidase [Caldimonas sp.]
MSRFVQPLTLRGLAGASLLWLGACSSPLPRPVAPPPLAAPSAAPAQPRAAAPVAVAPVSPALPAPPIASAPVASAPLEPAPVPTPVVVSVPAISPAVAARFPEPAVSFATPAFEPGRTAFTRNDELRAILHGLVRASDGSARGTAIDVLPLGSSQRGAPIEALAFTRAVDAAPAAAAPASAAASAPIPLPLPARRPAVLVIAGQHGDEPASTEALVVIAQQLAAGRFDRVLDQVDVFLLPRANPDGAALGQRATADGHDLNRDHLLLATPEAQAQAQLVRDIAPIVVLDLHEYRVDDGLFVAKFGAVQRFDALLQYATTGNLPRFVTKASEEWFRAPLASSLNGAGFATDWYHTVSVDPADRKVAMGGVGAQIGRNANGLKNAVSLIVETRGGGLGRTDLKRRVQVQVSAVGNVLATAARRADDLVKLRQFVERDVAAGACQGEAVIDAERTPSEYALAMLDPQSGAIRRVTVAWDSALELKVLRSRPRPCGYWLAASENDAVRRLRLLGVEVQQLDLAGEMRGEAYRETGRAAATGDVGEAAVRLRVQTQPVLIDVPAASYYVSLEQPLANLAIAALEPESPVGYAANGVISSVESVARVLSRPEQRMTAVP